LPQSDGLPVVGVITMPRSLEHAGEAFNARREPRLECGLAVDPDSEVECGTLRWANGVGEELNDGGGVDCRTVDEDDLHVVLEQQLSSGSHEMGVEGRTRPKDRR
jgi:hypothetical protein